MNSEYYNTYSMSRKSTAVIRTRVDEDDPFSTATYRSQDIPDLQTGNLGHHKQTSLQLQQVMLLSI